MAKSNSKKVKAEVKETTGITLQVPNSVYYPVKRAADEDTIDTGTKKTIHDKMVEILAKSMNVKL